MGETQLSAALDLEGLSADEAFTVLGDQTRLDIIRTLWQAGAAFEYVDGPAVASTLSFSELRREVDIDDNGRFNYHLSQLTPHFVRRTADGYRLSGAGSRIARTVLAVSGPDHRDLSADIDQDCPWCGSTLSVTYADQWLRVRCSGCDGVFGDQSPSGTIYQATFPPGGFSDRTTEDAVRTGPYRCLLDLAYGMRDICRECAGTMSASLSICHDHPAEAGAACEDCGSPFPVWGEQWCEVCGFAKKVPVEMFVLPLTPVIGFLDRQGIDVLETSFDELVELLGSQVETTVSTDPTRVHVTIAGSDGRIAVSLDDEMNVLEVERTSRAE